MNDLPRKRSCRAWSAEEDQLLLEMTAAGLTCEDVGALLDRSSDAVRVRRPCLSSPTKLTVRWTECEDTLLRELCPLMNYRQLGALLGRSLHAVESRMRTIDAPTPMAVRPKWTEHEDAVLHQHYPHMPNRALAALLPGRTTRAVTAHAAATGLSKSAQYYFDSGLKRFVQFVPELQELRRLSQKLRKALADEERRRSSGDAVRRPRSAEQQPRRCEP